MLWRTFLKQNIHVHVSCSKHMTNKAKRLQVSKKYHEIAEAMKNY